MNKCILSLVCLLFLVASCTQQNEKEITLFNDFKFATGPAEHIADLDSLAKVPYVKYFNNLAQVQVPLYRIIEGKGYHIYLGIPFHTSLEKMAKMRTEQPMADTVLYLKQDKGFFYRRFIRDSLYLTEYIRPLDSVSIICIYAATKDSTLGATLLSEEQLSARIIKNK